MLAKWRLAPTSSVVYFHQSNFICLPLPFASIHFLLKPNARHILKSGNNTIVLTTTSFSYYMYTTVRPTILPTQSTDMDWRKHIYNIYSPTVPSRTLHALRQCFSIVHTRGINKSNKGSCDYFISANIPGAAAAAAADTQCAHGRFVNRM